MLLQISTYKTHFLIQTTNLYITYTKTYSLLGPAIFSSKYCVERYQKETSWVGLTLAGFCATELTSDFLIRALLSFPT